MTVTGLGLGLGLVLSLPGAYAVQADISSTPLASTVSAQVKPNIMLLMDTSGSMGWSHMPDEVETVTGVGSVGYKSASCNVLYYNRLQTYLLPLKSDGTPFPAPSFTAAPYAGYVAYYVSPDATDTSVVDLSIAFRAFDAKTLRVPPPPALASPAQAAFYYRYSGNQALAHSAAPCTDPDTYATDALASKPATGTGTGTSAGTWTRVTVSTTSGPNATDERQNFAIWYTYYRTRISLTKSAASRAFVPLTDTLRVGFITVKPKDAPAALTINPSRYLPIDDFNAVQRDLWFNKLFAQSPEGSSPAREGLARVGRHYAGRQDGINAGMTGDPVQYACQQNFTIMTTDGYWNAQAESPGGGPVGIDGTTRVGQQDGVLTNAAGDVPRPVWDGAATSIQTDRDASNFFYDEACTGTASVRSTAQTLASTHRIIKSTTQTSKTAQQYTSAAEQTLQTTQQFTASTRQTFQATQQYTTTTRQLSARTSQYRTSTDQTLQTTLQYSTAVSQTRQTTYQQTQSTLQYLAGQTQRVRRDYQVLSFDSLTELGTPVASCMAGGSITCLAREVMPLTPVASGNCTVQSTGAPDYIVTDCSTYTVSAATPVASCTPGVTFGGGPDYLTSTCTGTVPVPLTRVASCAPGTTTSGSPAYIATTCTTTALSTSVPVPSCSNANSGSPDYITTTCATAVVQPTQPSPPCTAGSTLAAAPDYLTTTCSKSIDTANVNVPNLPVCADQVAASANNWTAVTCNRAVTPLMSINTPCVAGTTVNASYLYTTCSVTVVSPSTPVASTSCPGAVVGPAPDYNQTVCSATVPSAPVGVSSCTPGTTIGPAPDYLQTLCFNTSSLTPATACTPQLPDFSNGYLAITCPAPRTTPPKVVASCTQGLTNSGAPDYITTDCSVATLTRDVPVAACTPGVSAFPDYINTLCRVVPVSALAGVASCTPGTTTSGAPNYVRTTCASTSTAVFVANAAACAPQTADSTNGYVGITCNTILSASFAAACTVGQAGAPSYLDTTCATTPESLPVPVASCLPGTSAGPDFLITTCSAGASTGPTPAATCTPGTGPAPDFIATTCETGPAPGVRRLFSTTITTTTSPFSGSLATATPTVVVSPPGAPTPTDGVCYVAGVNSPPPLPSPNPQRPGVSDLPAPPATCSAWSCTTRSAALGGSTNSLADVAQYYYTTDLRSGAAWPNNVPSVGVGPEDDRSNQQHMTTFTVALGVSGTLNFRPDYKSLATLTGDFASIRTGIGTMNPDGTSSATVWPVWPDPLLDYTQSDAWNDPKSIDDFWHAAVNGRGQYFSAGNPSSLIAGLSGALAGVEARLSSGAAAGTSSLEPVAGDNFVFFASYTTSKWTGDVVASEFDLNSGVASTSTAWSAQARLDLKTGAACDNRSIYLIRPGAVNNLVNFSWNSLACDASGLPTGVASTGLNAAEMANFDATKVLTLSQYPAMTDGSVGSVDQRSAAAGANLVNFLRGQRGLEAFEAGAPNKLYRSREHVLGDVIGGQPVYVRAPVFTYQDTGYQDFKLSQASRTPMVYVAANDGMLHAFHAGTRSGSPVIDPLGGQEAWAIVPTAVLPRLYKLGDNNYRNVHQFYLDGTPVVGDVRDASTATWKSLLVGGMNAGGKAYYAIDVTDPLAPKALWEFKFSDTCYSGTPATADADCHLGLSFGKPVITKIRDAAVPEGRWVVLVSSGYNNVRGAGAAGDGRGFLYVLDAITGLILYKIDSGAGDVATPSNLGQLNTYVDDAAVNNLSLRVYGTDMLGNVLRFDVNDTEGPAGRESALVGQARDAGGNPQPITTRPELAELNGKPMVFVATGRLLGASDIGDTQSQSIYGIVDPLSASPVYPDLRAALKPMVMTSVGAGPAAFRSVACSALPADAARCTSASGWVIDLPDTSERVNVDMKLVLGTLVAGSNVPTLDACSTGGHSWLSYVDFATGTSNGSFGGGLGGGAVENGLHVSQYLTSSLIVGVGVIRLPSGQFKSVLRTSGSEASASVSGLIERPLFPPPPAPRGKRISWREIAQ